MAQNAKSLTYKLRAEYEGKGDLKQLQSDLKALGQVESFKKLQESFAETNKQMVDAKAKVRALKQDMKASGGEEFAAAYEKAKKEVQSLSTSLQKQKSQLDAARRAMQEQGQSVSGLVADYDRLQKAAEQQGTTIAARQKLQIRSWRDIEQEIKGLERAYDDLKKSGTLSVNELAAAEAKLQARTKALNAEMGAGNERFSRTTLLMGKMRTVASSMVSPLTAMVGAIGLIGAGYGIANMVTDVVRAEREIGNMANTTGLSASEFQAFAYGAQTVGYTMDKLSENTKDMKEKIADYLETGGGEFADFMENVASQTGLAAEELIHMSGPDVLIAMKEAMEEAGVETERQKKYFEDLANDASLLIPLLEDGGKKWKELAEDAREMGIAISDLDAKQLDELATTMDEITLSMGIMRREAVLALAPSLKELAAYIKENREEIGEFVRILASGAGKLLEFVVENRNLIAIIGGGVTTILGASVAFGVLEKTVAAVKFAYAGLGPVGVLAAGALASVAWGIKQNVDRYNELNDLQRENEALARQNATANSELAAKFSEISKATGVTVTSMEELDQAVKDGKIHFDASVGGWVAGYATISNAAKKSATEQKRVQGDALKKMQSEYEAYVDKIKTLQQQISDNEQRLYEYTRDLAREGMSDIDAYDDLKKQAEEYRVVAEAAIDAGMDDTALDYFQRMEDAYKQLATEVKDGDKVLISQQAGIETKTKGVTDAINGQIHAQQNLQEVAVEAMEALTSESGWQDLGKNMDEAKQTWIKNWALMRDKTFDELSKVEKRIEEIVKDETKNIYVNVKASESRSGGGAIGSVLALAGGGSVRSALSGMYFPGYGGGDRRHVIAEDGEVMLRKEAVRAGGLRAALAFNQGRFDVVVKELLSRFDLGSILRKNGGSIDFRPTTKYVPMPHMPQMLAAGGVVAGSVSAAGSSYNITLNYSGGGSRADADKMADMVLRSIKRKAGRLS